MLRAAFVMAAFAFVALVPGLPALDPAEPFLVYAEEEGRFAVGLVAAAVDGANLARVPFDADDCRRDLRLMLHFDPRNASVDADVAYVATPFEFEVRLVDTDGDRLDGGTFRYLAPGTHGYRLEEPGRYAAEVVLMRGADTSWWLRVAGWKTVDAECRWQGSLFVNEAEGSPPPGGTRWVEVHNAGFDDVDLAGWSLSGADDAVALGGTVVAGGFLVVPVPESFPLDAAAVGLVAPRGWDVDRAPPLTDEAGDDRSWQRTPDGADAWEFRDATPGAGNSPR